MAQMHGKFLFVGLENVKGNFFIDIAPAHEIEHPFRSCNWTWYIHFWPGKALAIGWWRKRHSETENLMRAIGGRNVEEDNTFGFLSASLRPGTPEITQDEFS